MEDNKYTFDNFKLNSTIPIVMETLKNNPDELTELFESFYDVKISKAQIYFEDLLDVGTDVLACSSILSAALSDNLNASLFLFGGTLLSFGLCNIVNRINTSRKLYQGLNYFNDIMYFLDNIDQNEQSITNEQIHEVTDTIQNNTVCYDYSKYTEHKMPVAFSYDGLLITLELDSYITRMFELAYNIFEEAYDGYEDDIVVIYSVLYLYSSRLANSDMSLIHKDHYVNFQREVENRLIEKTKEKKLTK